jgi:hypothetical protein
MLRRHPWEEISQSRTTGEDMAYCESMPNRGKWLWDDMQDTNTSRQKGRMIVANMTEVLSCRRSRMEIALPIAGGHTRVISINEGTAIS